MDVYEEPMNLEAIRHPRHAYENDVSRAKGPPFPRHGHRRPRAKEEEKRKSSPPAPAPLSPPPPAPAPKPARLMQHTEKQIPPQSAPITSKHYESKGKVKWIIVACGFLLMFAVIVACLVLVTQIQENKENDILGDLDGMDLPLFLDKMVNKTRRFLDNLSDAKSATSVCPVLYSSKCFTPITIKMNLSAAVSECHKIDAELANIYSRNHMQLLVNYLRKEAWWWTHATIDFHLGMKFALTPNSTLLLSTGLAAPDLDWDEGYPKAVAANYHLLLRVNKNPDSPDQYLWNISPGGSYYAICEAPIIK